MDVEEIYTEDENVNSVNDALRYDVPGMSKGQRMDALGVVEMGTGQIEKREKTEEEIREEIDHDEELLDMVAAMPPWKSSQLLQQVQGGGAKDLSGDEDLLGDIDMLLEMEETELTGNGDGTHVMQGPGNGTDLQNQVPKELGQEEDHCEEAVAARLEQMMEVVRGHGIDSGDQKVQDEGIDQGQARLGIMRRHDGDDVIPEREMKPPQRHAIDATDCFVTVTSLDGERVYVPMMSGRDEEAGMGEGLMDEEITMQCGQEAGLFNSIQGSKYCLARALRRSRGSLLSTKIDDLLAEVEKDHFERALLETELQNSKKKKNNLGKSHSARGKQPSEKAIDEDFEPKSTQRQVSSLWVDKYAPVGFLDLLSDEMINRDVVRWVKEWDTCVFGKEENTANTRMSDKRHDTQTLKDPYHRPEHKIILLAGPPGLGKTTLAHIVARHCGYKPMEINASDERSGPALLSKVQDATEMTSVIGEKRPNCIIIDEIDGVAAGQEAKGAISALIKLATAMPHATKQATAREEQNKNVEAGNESSNLLQKASKKPKKSAIKPLLRPIICICNDLYAPVLRPLREVAKVFTVKPPSQERLVERLKTICAHEGLKTEKSTLRALVDRAECDIRACLNTLQFISKKQRYVRPGDVSSIGVGQKDISIGAFRLWKDLLHSKKKPAVIGQVGETESQRCSRLYGTLLDFGDPDLVLGGIYESLPSIILFDMALMKTSNVLDNMQLIDQIQRHSAKTAEFSMIKYLPASILQVTTILSGPERPQISWPRTMTAAHRDMNENKSLVQKWMLGMRPDTFVCTSRKPAILDVVPYLPWVMTPHLRPVSRHLYSKLEKESLGDLVNAMLQLGLSFSLEEAHEAEGDQNTSLSCIQFNPPVHRLCQFPQKTPAPAVLQPRQMPIPTRQMVVHELEMEKIKRSSTGKTHVISSPQADVQTCTPSHHRIAPLSLAERIQGNQKKVRAVQNLPARKRNWLDTLKAKEITKKKDAVHGTKRFRRAENMPVLYKFHEGYTNAVKKPIKMFELL